MREARQRRRCERQRDVLDVLSIGKLVDAGYYLDRVASGVEDYYTLKGEAPGVWLGQGAAELGLSGRVQAEDLRVVLAGFDPETGASLGLPANRRVGGYDLCFRAPKSVSVLAGLGDADTAGVVRACHDEAVAAAFGYLEHHAAFGRHGHNGVEQVKGNGLIAAAFRHRTSRAGDPHLHTHVLVVNALRRPDGSWGTIDARHVFAHAKTAGCLYEAHLRAALTRELGVDWDPVCHGIADLVGIP
jgi:conjugative relaxase-like TrwC/TraI family protein